MPDPSDMPNLWDQAQSQFPILQNQDVGYKEDFGRGAGYLESWPPGETGSDELQRPTDLDINKFGVEVYDRTTRPIDILGDVVSHKLVNEDPVLKQHYSDFSNSLEPWQNDILNKQYSHAQTDYGENRSFDNWKKDSGLPAYYRGYQFDQWGKDSKDYYTKDQIKGFDEMKNYYQTGKSK